MHSPFTFNPNVHRTYQQQQQSGFHQQPIYNIGVPPPTFSSGFMSHPPSIIVHPAFTRSFASVVSCENNFGLRQQGNIISGKNNINVNSQTTSNNNPGFISSLLKHFNKPSMPQYKANCHQPKEFEDFTHIPSVVMDLPHFNINIDPHHVYQHSQQTNTTTNRMKSDSFCSPQQSANFNSQTAPRQRNFFMASFLDGYQQMKPKYPRWYQRGGFRCGRGKSKNNNSNKFHHDDVNMAKNIHEKERSSVERNIQDDSCDFVDVKDATIECGVEIVMSTENPNKTAKGSCSTMPADDPPFMIYSMEEFPAIVTETTTTTKGKKKTPLVDKKSPPAKYLKEEKSEGFVVVPTKATLSLPSFTPKRISLCEKIIASPQKLFPTKPLLALKPCLKPSRRTVSECSDDDFIVFADDDCDGAENQDESIYDDDDSESESDDDEIGGDEEMSCDEEEDDDVVDHPETPETQLDSGVEERKVSHTSLNDLTFFTNLNLSFKVHFNLTPKVHVMRVWNYAYRAYRKCDYWQQVGRDHERFGKRISQLESVLNPILDAGHRGKVFLERFEERV